MVSPKYDTLKYYYDSDLNEIRIKYQRAYYKEENGVKLYTTPITPLFLARQYIGEGKTYGTNRVTRRLVTYVEIDNDVYAQRTANLPYAPGNNLLNEHIKEILEVVTPFRVICGNYEGETPLEK